MIWQRLKSLFSRFREETNGSFMVESVIAIPLLFWTVAATFEFFEVHRYKSVREKATYTIADMISREQSVIDDTYIDNTKVLFDNIVTDQGTNQLRVSIIRYDATNDVYTVFWSEVRGTGPMFALDDQDVATSFDKFPVMSDGEDVIVVESVSNYDSLFDLVLQDTLRIETRVFTSIRFASQIHFQGVTI